MREIQKLRNITVSALLLVCLNFITSTKVWVKVLPAETLDSYKANI